MSSDFSEKIDGEESTISLTGDGVYRLLELSFMITVQFESGRA